MQLVELLKDWPCKVKGSIRLEVRALAEHSETVTEDTLFIAHNGRQFDSGMFIEKAIGNGATVIVTDNETLFNSLELPVTLIWVPNTRTFAAFVSHRFYGEPSHAVKIIAVTGTNGKTTVSHFIGQLAQQLGERVCVIGTNGVYINGVKQNEDLSTLTTKSPLTLHRLIKQAISKNVGLVVLEASSMGLETARLDYCQIDVGVFLNLSQEHIEDHRSYNNYKLAKKHLVALSDKIVSNADDVFCQSVALSSNKPYKLFSCSVRADVTCTVLHETTTRSFVKFTMSSVDEVCQMPFAAPFLRSNVCAAVTALLQLGYNFEQLIAAVPELTLPTGRLEQVVLPSGATAIIDYAHTPEAFKQLFSHIQTICRGKIIAVFSCGGERDHAKRQEMGCIASKYADMIILTTDNCRHENPQHINKQIRSGFFATQQFEEHLDRYEAIARAIKLAESNDYVLIVGKGHETYQIIGDTVTDFDDKEAVQQLVADLYKET